MRRGEIDKIIINTTGVGIFINNESKKLSSIKEGDKIIVTGNVGNHGVHILSMRAGLGFENKIASDCAPLNKDISAILSACSKSIRCMRDLTRGGIGCILNEIAISTNKNIAVKHLEIQHETRMARELLGISPLYLANEGNICIFCDPLDCENILHLLKNESKYCKQAYIAGEVVEKPSDKTTPIVTMVDDDGKKEIIQYLDGAQLPRLC